MSSGSAAIARAREPRGKTLPMVQSDEVARDLRKGEATRERILAVAETMVLSQGFGSTSIDGIIAEAKLTKSGFFYHFRDKTELAREMLRRYIATNDRLFDELHTRASERGDDPLEVFLIWLKLLAGIMRTCRKGILAA